ncbi:MAG TPA: glutaminase A [Promineifilum sp.]|nr:glutaminase A [Promineifilum sp.]
MRAAKKRNRYISTGQLPPSAVVQQLVNEAYERFKDNDEGQNASHYPALARVPRRFFGICVLDTSGLIYAAGDTEYPFTLMSVVKPFTFALICAVVGTQEARDRLGLNATGLPFNSITAIEQSASRLTNPMVNSGAITAVSLAPGATAEEKWQFIQGGLSRFAGRPLALDEEVFASASATNHRNRAIARILYDYGLLDMDPMEATDIYTRQCSLSVTARDLAVMADTLANGGVNSQTGEQVIDAIYCQHALATMATAGMYENSGDWLFDTGLPAKSGISGGIIAAAPGKGGVGAFSPPLDAAGNSVRGQLAIGFLSAQLGLNLFASTPKA